MRTPVLYPPGPSGTHRRWTSRLVGVDDGFQRLLLAWYDEEARQLPWRRTDDPYAVLVSEFMLQQTQAARVVGPYRRFLESFPSVRHLAAAGPGAVIDHWRGLGYNRRAVALHRSAEAIVARHGGQVPRDRAQLEALPGVGAYTARAVLAFAFDEPSAPVDVNIARVLTRAVVGSALSRAATQTVADRQVAPPRPAASRPGAWSQALMDLGATRCVARRPRCATCPVRTHCAWRAAGYPDDPAEHTAVRARPQGRFAGSDRQYRGRLLDAVRAGAVMEAAVPGIIELPDDPDRVRRLVGALVADGLLRRDGDRLVLP